MSEEVKFTLENTKKVLTFLQQNTDKNSNINLHKELSHNIDDILERKKNLVDIQTTSILANNKLSLKEKNKEIELLSSKSLDELEDKFQKAKEIQKLENKIISNFVNNIIKNHTFKNDEIIEKFDDFYNAKMPNLIQKEVEESNMLKNYQANLSKFVIENKKQDSPFMKLLNYYANLPSKILEQGFKDALKEDIALNIKNEKSNIAELIELKFQQHNQKKDKNKDR